MKTFLTVLFSMSFLICNAQNQDKKIKKVKSDKFIEVFTINKINKLKDGVYYKIKRESEDTLIIGDYKDDKKVGLWKYKDLNKKDYIIYNYDSFKLEYISNSLKSIDTFYIKSDSSFVLGKVDSPPIYLGYENEIKELLNNNTLPTIDIMEKSISSVSIATFIVDKFGNLINIQIERSISKEFDKNILKSIRLICGSWIPAKLNGNNIDTKIYVMFQVSNSFTPKYYPNKPYIIPVLLSYYGVQRSERVR